MIVAEWVEENAVIGRADPIDFAKGGAALVGSILLLALIVSGTGGIPFGLVLLAGCFLVPPAVLAMMLALLIGRWIGLRTGVASGWMLMLSLPFGFAAGVGGFSGRLPVDADLGLASVTYSRENGGTTTASPPA